MTKYYIGLMSGTSLDGVDAAIVAVNKNKIKLIEQHNLSYSPSLQTILRDLTLAQDFNVDAIGECHIAVGETFARAAIECLNKTDLTAEQITAIGSHGQTIRHRPQANHPFTWQLGDPNTIAARTGIATVSDFRGMDVANGGQGAPLAPIFHRPLFGDDKNRIIVNIGGIANISYCSSDKDAPLVGFDTGPGNTLLDAWVQLHLNRSYDDKGDFARAGTVIDDLLNAFLSDPYFKQTPPKSTGTEHFNAKWVENNLAKVADVVNGSYSAEGVQASLALLTARTIAGSIKDFMDRTKNPVDEIIVCGGGSYNDYLMEVLDDECAPMPTMVSDAVGVPADAIEAMGFAWLAKCRMDGVAVDLSSATGSCGKLLLGTVVGLS
jgi:anhydro-N-acetylmuramic acid kinase